MTQAAARNDISEALESAPVTATPSTFLNRELSLLQFNVRVLEQARDPSTPLLERFRFLTISSSNLDEFFEIRVSGLKQQVAYGVAPRSSDGSTPMEALERISEAAHRLVT